MLAQLTMPTIADLRTTLEGFVTTETRIAVSVGLLLAGLVVSLVVLPFLLRRTERTISARFATGRFGGVTSAVSDYVPKTVGDLVLRTVQLAILGVTAVAVLVVWGLTGLVRNVAAWTLLSAPVLGKLGGTAGVVLGTYVGLQILKDSIARFSNDVRWMTQHQQEILLRMTQLVVLSFAALVLLGVWNVNLDALFVGAGFLGIVVGLAARQTLGSIIAGFLLMFSRPFTIGDWVTIGDHEGVVTDITIVHTRLENFDGESVVIPNDRVSDSAVTNRTQRGGFGSHSTWVSTTRRTRSTRRRWR
ncbi:mechanosensitive ion channel domain-containing protein [Haloarculaceae archaeon H-GB11]|nr:mechanosensitive ion channel domain-containing protein [Haloarculaceae archaeon H-GB11]